MKIDANEIFNEFEELIKKSCDFQESPTDKMRDFHKEFLKLAFGAMDVKIDYLRKTIVVWSPKPINPESFSIHNLHQSISGKIEYEDLESTLTGCMISDDFHARFYKHFLIEYGNVYKSIRKVIDFQSK